MSEPTRKSLFIKTWGCQMNVYDSGRMADVLFPLGYDVTQDVAQADLVIFNTCHIREKASEKLFSELGRLHRVQKECEARGHKMRIAVAGCVAQAVGEEIKRRAPYVEIIVGPQAYHHLPELLARAAREEGGVLDTSFPVEPKFDFLPQGQGQSAVCAFLAVQEGCDRFCSYCVVPYTRGAEYSRPFAALIEEAQALVDKGACEITLLGQNVNAYHDEVSDTRLHDVLEKLAGIKDLLRLRYTTSHPLDMGDGLIAAHRDIPKLAPFLHLPVQSGSDRILQAMNRKHTAKDYYEVVARLRKAQPALALSSDFIVGFPGETDQDFEDTYRLVQEIGYTQAFSFKYSRRPGTPASVMTAQVPEDVKEERLARLQALLRQQQTDFNHACKGKEMDVLIENESRHAGMMFGRTVYMQTARVKGDASLVGTEKRVVIGKAFANSVEE